MSGKLWPKPTLKGGRRFASTSPFGGAGRVVYLATAAPSSTRQEISPVGPWCAESGDRGYEVEPDRLTNSAAWTDRPRRKPVFMAMFITSKVIDTVSCGS